MLKQRLIVGIIGAIFMIAVLILADVRFISAVLGIIAVIGLSEMYNVTGVLKTANKLCLFSYAYVFVMYLLIGFIDAAGLVAAVGLVVYGLCLLVYMVFNHEKCDFNTVCSLFVQTAYVSVLFAHIMLVRKLSFGEYTMWFIFVTAWLSDTLAYAVGLRFGRNKLMPTISPKKTVEGAIGGLAGSLIFNLIYGAICSLVFKLSVNYLALVIMALVVGVMSQLGDLVASCIKREYGTKDYSNLLPGHGGILDRFDSVLFVAPVIYYFVIIFPVIA